MKIMFVVGARPNFMKIAPIVRAIEKEPQQFSFQLLHTGQHYDDNMSRIFFEELDIPKPDINLEVGSASHAQQTSEIMRRFEPILLDYEPDWLVVPGDVNSTLACALVASKLGVRIAHVEAGLRSFDRRMPEEINRVLTDQISDLLLTPSRDGDENLLKEGIAAEKIHFVGNAMIDTLVRLLPRAQERWPLLCETNQLSKFVLVTLHRPSNVDNPHTLTQIMLALYEIAEKAEIVFPVHPRTRNQIQGLDLPSAPKEIKFLEPLGYLDFLCLQAHAALVLTDSGGVQEETTYLGVPCLTARPNTERPVTITHGTNRLVASERAAIVKETRDTLNREVSETPQRPPLWDGRTAERIKHLLVSR